MASKLSEDNFFNSFVEEIKKRDPKKTERLLLEYSRQCRGEDHDLELLIKLAREAGLLEVIHSYKPPESKIRKKINGCIPFALLIICVILLIITF